MKSSSKKQFNTNKPTPVLANKELEALRVRTWFFNIANQVIGSEVDDFKRVLWEQVVLDSDEVSPNLSFRLQVWLRRDAQIVRLSEENLNLASNLRYVGYHTGKTSPSNTTLALFEELLPGSRDEYDYGPQGEPMWGILDGKIGICEAYVEQCLPPDSSHAEIDFNGRVQCVFDALIAPAYRIKLNSIPDFGKVQKAEHPVYLTHVNEVMRMTYDEDDDSELLSSPTIDDQILLAIALWQIALDRKEGPVLRLEWLLTGLCRGVIAHHFNEEVQSFILKLLRERGTDVDCDLNKRGVKMLDFEKRWTSEIGLERRAEKIRKNAASKKSSD